MSWRKNILWVVETLAKNCSASTKTGKEPCQVAQGGHCFWDVSLCFHQVIQDSGRMELAFKQA